MARIATFLMFNNQAEEAVKYYVSVFKNSKILNISRYGEKEIDNLSRLPEDIRPGPVGAVKSIRFLLDGEEFEAANGGPFFSFNHGISLYAKCETQAELDEIWEKLSDGGEVEECGWLRDRFGVSWQIAPAMLDSWIFDPDEERAQRVALAVLQSKKLDFDTLRKAYDGSVRSEA